MTISVYLDPTQLPNQSQDQLTFDALMGLFFQLLPTFGNQVNATVGQINALLAGGAYALPYIVDLSSTADGDPGVGKLRFSSTTQNASTTLRLDTSSGGSDISSMLDTFDASTSAVKGSFKIVKAADLSKFLTFDITARAAPSGYRNFTVTNTGGSSGSPFVNGDSVLVFFQRNGDMGSVANSAMTLIASADITSAVASIDFLSLFSSAYDKYVIELSGWTFGSPALLNLYLATGGVIPSTINYSALMANAATTSTTNTAAVLTLSTIYTGGTEAQHGAFTIEISNANDANAKTINVRGTYLDNANTTYVYAVNGSIRARGSSGTTGALSGFRLQPSSGGTFTKAKVRVYGIRNS